MPTSRQQVGKNSKNENSRKGMPLVVRQVNWQKFSQRDAYFPSTGWQKFKKNKTCIFYYTILRN